MDTDKEEIHKKLGISVSSAATQLLAEHTGCVCIHCQFNVLWHALITACHGEQLPEVIACLEILSEAVVKTHVDMSAQLEFETARQAAQNAPSSSVAN